MPEAGGSWAFGRDRIRLARSGRRYETVAPLGVVGNPPSRFSSRNRVDPRLRLNAVQGGLLRLSSRYCCDQPLHR